MGLFSETEDRLSVGTLNHAIGPENGPPLVILHGVTRRWQCLLPMIESLMSRWQIFAVDFPGHGKSRADCSNYTVVDYGNVMEEWLSRRFREPVVVYGHSLGAMVAADIAGRIRSNVAAVILEDPPFQTMGEKIAGTPLLSYFQGLRTFAGVDLSATQQVVRRLGELEMVDPKSGRTTQLREVRSAPALRFMASCLSQLEPRTLEPIVAGCRLRDYSLINVARRLTLPVLMLQADSAQGGMLTDDEAKIVSDLGQDVTCLKRGGVGHQMHWSEPEALSREVTLFLESLPLRQKWVD